MFAIPKLAVVGLARRLLAARNNAPSIKFLNVRGACAGIGVAGASLRTVASAVNIRNVRVASACVGVVAISLATPVPAVTRPHLEVRIPVAPQIVARSDGRFIGYEIHLTNYSSRPIRLQALELRDADTGRTVATIAGPALSALVGGQWVPENTPDRSEIAGGGRAVLFVDRPVDGAAYRRLTHRITYTGATGDPITIDAPAVTVSATRSPVLAPPLRGGPWIAVYAPGMEFGHRRYVYAVDGVARIPGRYAIDFFGADRTGKTAPERYDAEPGYGADVLAVADGTIVATRDDMPDPAGPKDKASPVLDDGAGNHIVLDLGKGRFAFYEHLRRGLRVRPGDRVRRGQVIASLGATGHVGGPHLHFHVGDGPDALRAEGLPFVLTGFDRIGGFASIKEFDARSDWARDPVRRSQVTMPAPNVVVRFGR